MKKPKYLQAVAHVFADPILENTGLEGGHLINALALMQEFIVSVFYKNFPEERVKLEHLSTKIERCKQYLTLIDQDRKANTNHAFQMMSKDITSLTGNGWLLMPGGWHGRTKPGHAMLYLVLPNHKFVVITTGSGSEYLQKHPLPHTIQFHFLNIKLENVQHLITNGVLEALLELLIRPADYYSASFLFEVILPIVGGQQEAVEVPAHAFEGQLAGTCFWQCVIMLFFYLYRDKKNIFLQMQQQAEKYLLEKVFHELQGYINGAAILTEADMQSAPWATYFQLIQFAIRHYCLKQDQIQLAPHQIADHHRLFFLLQQLDQYASQQLEMPLPLNLPLARLTQQHWCIDSFTTQFEHQSNTQEPEGNHVLPPRSYQRDNFIEVLERTFSYGNAIKWNDQASLINRHFILEQLFHYLPLPGTSIWAVFLSTPFNAQETERIAHCFNQLLVMYYKVQAVICPRPSPDQYARQLIAGFSVFCFVDAVIKQLPETAFMSGFVCALQHLSSSINLAILAPQLILTSPQLSLQLMYVLRYLQSLPQINGVFNFSFEVHIRKWSIELNEQVSNADVELLNKCLQAFQRQESFDSKYHHLPISHRHAYGIIDNEGLYLPQLIHCWRNIGLICRLLLSGYEKNDNLLNHALWSLSPLSVKQNAKICLTLDSHKNFNVVHWAKYQTAALQDPALAWLCDTPSNDIIENNVIINLMPQSEVIKRRTFNELAEIRASENLQIVAMLEWVTQHVHYLQFPETRLLIEKYLYEAGQRIVSEGSLLYQECQQSTLIKQLLLQFMNTAEYYFCGQINRIQTYLALIRLFLTIERFLIQGTPQLICSAIFEKLYALIRNQDKHHGEIAAHLILLYQNAWLIPISADNDLKILNPIVICWAHLLRAKLLSQTLSADNYRHAKCVLLSLQDRLQRYFQDQTFSSQLADGFLSVFLNQTQPKRRWEQVSSGCFVADDYYINLFEGKVYFKKFLLSAAPEEIVSHPDYQQLFNNEMLAIELERASPEVRKYRTVGHATCLLTVYQQLKMEATKNLDDGIYSFCIRQYGHSTYLELNSCNNIHAGYFSPDFHVELKSSQLRVATQKSKRDTAIDIVIHQCLTWGKESYWAQFIPKWRLEGLLPAALLNDYRYWLVCTRPPTTDFMAMDVSTRELLTSATEKQTLFVLDKQQHCHYVCYILPGNSVHLLRLNDHGMVTAEWIDILRLASNSPLVSFCKTLRQFELPTYILVWREANDIYTIHLIRHKLSFRLHAALSASCSELILESLNFNDYHLTVTPPHQLPNIGYQLTLVNKHHEKIVLFPCFTESQQAFLNDDPLSHQIYSSLITLGPKTYFHYRYSEDLEELEADSILGEIYLSILYAKSRQYLKSYQHLAQCWTDQILTPEEWQMVLRFFAETKNDPHPDNHACRLHALLLYLPLFTLLHERKLANDVLDEGEAKQLKEYQDLFREGIIDYEGYLNKWKYIHHKLRLNRTQEQELMRATHMLKMEIPQLLNNRNKILTADERVVLKTPAYTKRTLLVELFKSNTFDEKILLEAHLSVSKIMIDYFGYDKDVSQSIMKCFFNLYNHLREGTFSVMRSQMVLRAIAWANQITPANVFEFNLLQLLRMVAATPRHILPPLPEGNTVAQLTYFSCQRADLNISDLSKKYAHWFGSLLQQLRGSQNRMLIMRELNLSSNLASREVSINLAHVRPNTCPSHVIKPPNTTKMRIHFNLIKFKSDYGFDPQQPLGHIFVKYFNRIQEKPPTRRFPLNASGDATSEYHKLFTDSELARHLLEYFRSDFDYFLTLLNDRFVMKGDGQLLDSLKRELLQFLTSLKELHSSLKARLLSLANKNPCKKDEAVLSADENKILGLQIKYLQLSGQRDALTLADVWQLLLCQTKSAFLAQNPFLNDENVTLLFAQTIEYLLLGNTLSIIIRIINLVNNYQLLTSDADKINLIAQIGKGCFQQRFYSPETMPLYLMLEYLIGSLLWQLQIDSVGKLKSPLLQQLIQIFLGGGKSSTIAPLLGCFLADGKRLMTYTIPPPLVAQFIQIIRNRLRGPLSKRVHTFSMQRSTLLTPSIVSLFHHKFQKIAHESDVLVITPEVPGCLLLKWLELSKLHHQGNRAHREVVGELDNILCFFGENGTQLIDEIDTVIAPQKSEINFTEGEPSVLSPAPMRWQLAQKLFLVLMTHSDMLPVLARGIEQHDCKSYGKHNVFKYGMLEIINSDYYQHTIKPALTTIIVNGYYDKHTIIRDHKTIFFNYLLSDPVINSANVLLLNKEIIVSLKQVRFFSRAQQEKLQQLELLLTSNANDTVLNKMTYYAIKNAKLYNTTIHPLLAELLSAVVFYLMRDAEEIALQIVLAKEIINNIFPHVLRNRLSILYGPYFEYALDEGGAIVKKYFLERKLPVPYTGKDRPSKRAEYQDPDVVVGYACLQYFYLGLREDELKELISVLQGDMEAEVSTPLQERSAVKRFRQWQLDVKITPVELNQIDLNAPWQISQLHRSIYQQTSVICYYLDRLVFPIYLKVYTQKLTSNGFDLAAMIFNVTKGITATVHNALCMPDSLTQHMQRGADGAMLYTLDLPANEEIILVDYANDEELLMQVNSTRFKMFVDPEGLIQQMSNVEVARFILNHAPPNLLGVIFIDDHTEQQRVITRGNIIQRINECTISPRQLFKYIDHAHIRGSDVLQALGDRGCITAGPSCTLETGFQGDRRLRMLDIYASQSMVTMMRKSDEKLVRHLLKLDHSTKLVSRHILQWMFSHTVHQISNELQVQIYQRLHAVIRRRAYSLLLGKYSYDRLPASLNDVLKGRLWQDLHESILDDYDRVAHEVKPNDMRKLDYLSADISRELQQTLTNLYRYRQKQHGLDTVTLCLQAFSENVSYLLAHALPIETSEHTADHLSKYLRTILEHFGGILLSSDRQSLESIVSHAQQFLPRWTTTKHLDKQVEREQHSAMQVLSHMRQQQNEHQSEKIRLQQQERQSHAFSLFKPAVQVAWQYQQLLVEGGRVTSFIISPSALRTSANQLRLLRLSEILHLPLSAQLLVSENFMRTEMQITDLRQFAKNILYFIEVQEHDSRQFIILDAKEAGYIRYCLDKRLLDSKAIGFYLLSGTLIAKSNAYTALPVPELLQVQLYFLNGYSENEVPSSYHAIWKRWKEGCDHEVFTQCQQRLQIALAK